MQGLFREIGMGFVHSWGPVDRAIPRAIGGDPVN